MKQMLVVTLLSMITPSLATESNTTGEATRETLNGCSCKQQWKDEKSGVTCETSCCNPSSSPHGDWCMVEDPTCEDAKWGYCRNLKEDQAAVTSNTCIDTEHWHDSDGEECSKYKSQKWCTEDGQVGIGWHEEEWGPVASYVANGFSAFEACCACGGGSRGERKPINVKVGISSFNVPNVNRVTYSGCKCKLTYHWTDSSCDGACCNPTGDPAGAWCHVQDPHCQDSDWGYCRPEGIDTAKLQLLNSSNVHGNCKDTPYWTDVEGDDCQTYALSAYCTNVGGYGLGWDMSWGTFASFASGVLGPANAACCACGGGTRLSHEHNDAEARTKPRTTWSGCACKRKWTVPETENKCKEYCCHFDHTGHDDEYAEHVREQSWCMVEDPACEDATWGYCQTSGLGTIAGPSQDAEHCSDFPEWTDSDGDSCRAYGESRWCTAAGSPGIGWHEEWGSLDKLGTNGHTPLAACCACGGGNRINRAGDTANPSTVDSMKSFLSGEKSRRAMWKVTKGPCTMDTSGCITSGNYPEQYSAKEQCEIVVDKARATPIHVVAFDTEATYDVLRVNGVVYSGKSGPKGIIPEETIYWGADRENEPPFI
eukprot:TRINITY_DN16086_c0_g1_i2.p1 TRINITY_DN16086_c0_g1~~TRINITY_DN16086_c0_g1_i2.p1  ORF type:complete len:614 (+),score=48.30 TRINITY_DN16086_c0_g1_i2:59-1843(+)